MRSLVVAVAALALAQSGNTAPAAAPVRAEIGALLAILELSACQFNRNGNWHSAAAAKAHLLRKLEYLEGKNAVQTTEQFIELGAASSSSSGKPYLVKCGDAAPVESRAWLLRELKLVRSRSGPS